MSDCPYHLTPEDTGERRRRTDLRIRLPGGQLRKAVTALLFSGGFTCSFDARAPRAYFIFARWIAFFRLIEGRD